MTLQAIKDALYLAIDHAREQIIQIGETVANNPEIGYREEETSALVRKVLGALSIPIEYPLAKTGVKGTLKGKSGDITVAVIGEMDALFCAGHPRAHASVAHACGHNAQIAAMLGTAIAFQKSGMYRQLDGNICFLAAPAEEFIDLSYRKTLRQSGEISYYGGKQQLLAEGTFRDIDMAMMLHAQPNEPNARVYADGYNLGFLAKTVRFTGKAAHGSTPFDGVNALNAAALSILGIHANRETFLDTDRIRIHPIITKGGDVVNTVPDEVCMDMYIRGASLAAIQKGDAAVNRAVRGAADMIGAAVTHEDLPGYLPLRESTALSAVFTQNARELIGDENIVTGAEITGSTDMGDVSHLIPVIQPSVGGFSGHLHGTDFQVANPEYAYILSAKLLAGTVAELLYHHAEKAKQVKRAYTPAMTHKEYISYLRKEENQ